MKEGSAAARLLVRTMVGSKSGMRGVEEMISAAWGKFCEKDWKNLGFGVFSWLKCGV